MSVWIIEPRDPLIARDGRPFGPTPGVQSNSLSFPFPSTTTGGVRTRAGLVNGLFDTEKTSAVKKISVRGPLLVQLKSEVNGSELEKWLVPAPQDALLFPGTITNQVQIKRLLPLWVPDDVETNLKIRGNDGLMLVGLCQPDESRKPAKDAPQFWYWDTYQEWLLRPAEHTLDPEVLGHDGPQRERRIHVSIDSDRLVGKDGALFGTSGLEFTSGKQHQLSQAQRLALAVAVEDDNSPNLTIDEGLANLGGERRAVSWRKSSVDFPACPAELADAIVQHRACRLFLLTPAYFAQCYRPTWLLDKQNNNVTAHLQALAIQRPQVVSGWDLEKRKPKPTRRLAPAGSVYFLSLQGTDEAIRSWIRGLWMQCISDDEQLQRDGFGLAVLGVWSGKPVKMWKEK